MIRQSNYGTILRVYIFKNKETGSWKVKVITDGAPPDWKNKELKKSLDFAAKLNSKLYPVDS